MDRVSLMGFALEIFRFDALVAVHSLGIALIVCTSWMSSKSLGC